MPKLLCSLIRINAKNDPADIWLGVDKENVSTKVIQLMASSATAGAGRSSGLPGDVMLESVALLFWCDDGKTHSFEIRFAHKNGLVETFREVCYCLI